MRHEHRQTLEFCDRLGLHACDQTDIKLTNLSCPVATVDDDYTLSTDNHTSLAGDLITTNIDAIIRPPFKARRAPPRKHVPIGSPQRKSAWKESQKRESEQFQREREEMREYALDKYLASLSDEDHRGDFVESSDRTKHERTKRRLVRSGSLSNLADDGWRYRVTVPRPFKMSVRESQKLPTKSRSATEFERQRVKKQMLEELECSMKFKASPAPSTIYVPMYEELTVGEERRRHRNMATRQKELAAMQRPFDLVRREEARLAEKHRRRAEFAEADARAPDANFKAKPFPRHLFSSEAHERMCLEEDEKEWQRRARAERLLQTSSLPKNMTKERPSHVCDMTTEEGDYAASCCNFVYCCRYSLIPTPTRLSYLALLCSFYPHDA